MIIVASISLLLVVTTFALHYRVLIWLAEYTPGLHVSGYIKMMIMILVIFTLHLVEIALYAFAYYAALDWMQLGELQGLPDHHALSYLYYSSATYTTLGMGDIYPTRHLRFITGIESLNGFLLITWSASFTYLAMNRILPWARKDRDSDL